MTNNWKIVVLSGVQDSNLVTLNRLKDGNITLGFPGNFEIPFEISFPEIAFYRIAIGGVTPPSRIDIPRDASLLLNCICDPDSAGKSLKMAMTICDEVPLPVVNHPRKIQATTRDGIYEALRDIEGLIVPKVLRRSVSGYADLKHLIENGELEYPFLIRPTGIHGGTQLALIQAPEDFVKLEALPLAGQEFYLTTYYDFKLEDGRYRKYRMVLVDGKVYPRHLIQGPNWSVHIDTRDEFMRDHPETTDEERHFLDNPNKVLGTTGMAAMRAIYEKIGLDILGVDFTLTAAGEILLFECNSCVRIFNPPSSPYLEPACPRGCVRVADSAPRGVVGLNPDSP